jgi:SAM-dependent methyltransferase
MSLGRGTLALSQTCHSGFVSNPDAEAAAYARFHQRRFSALVQLVGRLSPSVATILDVGPGHQTLLLRRRFPDLVIDSLGFFDARFQGVCRQHFDYDLSRAADQSSWPQAPQYDLVLFAEVIEHLPVAPRLVLSGLARYLNPGGFLVLQTPNAVSAWKRLEILLGRNPFNLIHETPGHSHHFREYTVTEILDAGRLAGLSVRSCSVQNYFGQRGPVRRAIYSLACAMLPGPARDGITVVFRRNSTGPSTS